MFFRSTYTPHLKGQCLKVLFDVKPVCGTTDNEGCCSEQPTESGVVDVRVHVTGKKANLKLVVVSFSKLFETTQCQELSSNV